MNVVIDQGNSTAKVGVFDHQTLVEKLVFSSNDDLRHYLGKLPPHNLMVSSVKTDAEVVGSWAARATNKFLLRHTLPVPVTNLYSTPATLGMDRLAGVCGAHQVFPLQHCLVIDAGTCITYDFLDKEGNFHGGAIGPGLSMRFQAVHTFTAKLPLVSAKETPKLIGDSTETCIQSGVVNGMLAEIEETIRQYEKKFEGLRVILTGGDCCFFENQMKASIFASPELVLIGLNSILNYNVNR